MTVRTSIPVFPDKLTPGQIIPALEGAHRAMARASGLMSMYITRRKGVPSDLRLAAGACEEAVRVMRAIADAMEARMQPGKSEEEGEEECTPVQDSASAPTRQARPRNRTRVP